MDLVTELSKFQFFLNKNSMEFQTFVVNFSLVSIPQLKDDDFILISPNRVFYVQHTISNMNLRSFHKNQYSHFCTILI